MNKYGFFNSGNYKLSFSCGTPIRNRKKIGVLFIHAAQGSKLGPHRMFVEMARACQKLGFPTFRFDLRGCGDSDGACSKGDTDKDISDTLNAVRYFLTSEKLRGVVLFAISRGSYVACHAAWKNDLPLKGMILLSTPVSDRGAALQTLKNYSEEYLVKLGDPQYLWKLVKGRVNLKGIFKTLKKALQLGNRYQKDLYAPPVKHCPILFIYGENDPLKNHALNYYSRICRKNNLDFECRIIEKANHSFFHYQWKEEILHIATSWLQKITTQNR